MLSARGRFLRAAAVGTLITLTAAACGTAAPAADDVTVVETDVVQVTEPGATAAPVAPGEVTEIDWLVTSDPGNIASIERVVEAFQADHPEIRVNVVARPGGTEGDNLVRTRLATGTMEDLFHYNSGSLLMALNPDQTLQDLSGEAWVSDVTDGFQTVVSTDGGMFGAPWGSSFGGGILYNIPIYEELGLEVPTNWDEFLANLERIKAEKPDVAPICQSFGDPWTAQIITLADFANVLDQDPNWANDFTANQQTFTTEPGIDGFRRMQQLHDLDMWNRDFASMRFDQALSEVATGGCAHYPQLTVQAESIAQNTPDHLNDVGFFAIPTMHGGDSQATMWYPDGIYVPVTTEGARRDAVMTLLNWITTSPEACRISQGGWCSGGPPVVTTCELGDDAPRMVTDLKAYVDAGRSAPALEFLSPVKGPNLERILVEVGSGIQTAESGAAMYDEDVRNQALQLGLPGWQ